MNVDKLSIFSTWDAVSLLRQTMNFVYTNLTVVNKITLVCAAAYNAIYYMYTWYGSY